MVRAACNGGEPRTRAMLMAAGKLHRNSWVRRGLLPSMATNTNHPTLGIPRRQTALQAIAMPVPSPAIAATGQPPYGSAFAFLASDGTLDDLLFPPRAFLVGRSRSARPDSCRLRHHRREHARRARRSRWRRRGDR